MILEKITACLLDLLQASLSLWSEIVWKMRKLKTIKKKEKEEGREKRVMPPLLFLCFFIFFSFRIFRTISDKKRERLEASPLVSHSLSQDHSSQTKTPLTSSLCCDENRVLRAQQDCDVSIDRPKERQIDISQLANYFEILRVSGLW